MSGALVVMPSNNTGAVIRGLGERFPGRLAHLMAPGGWRRPFLPYALDNGAFGSYLRDTCACGRVRSAHEHWGGAITCRFLLANREPFDRLKFRDHLTSAAAHVQKGNARPLWVAVPDVVEDRLATLAAWDEWAPKLRSYGWPLAFIVQDGMIRQDVPEDADFVFVGGSIEWKWAWVPAFAAWFGKRLHVGRVNSPSALDWLDQLGVGSCDGTGWFRGDPRQLRGLIDFLADERRNMRLFVPSEWVDVCA